MLNVFFVMNRYNMAAVSSFDPEFPLGMNPVACECITGAGGAGDLAPNAAAL